MLTTDSIYYKPLLPAIRIKTTDDTTDTYVYSAFTGSVTTGPSNVFPLYCSVTLSQNTHGEFTMQFEDPNRQMESVATVGNRVRISAGKQSTATQRLISGVVRRKGYSRGSDNRILYTIAGSSTAIRLNERVLYDVSQAAKTGTGQIDTTDATRKADTLLETLLSIYFTASNVDLLAVSGLASNSDVETFIPSLQIEYGELQDLVNYLEDQSGGEVIVDTSDVVHFRHELKNTLQGRGFTLKNSDANKANDDADDTMYMRGKNWSYEDSFYKSDVYGNRLYGLLAAEETPSNMNAADNDTTLHQYNGEWARKFRPSHSHWLPGDIYVGGFCAVRDDTSMANFVDMPFWRFRIAQDNSGTPGAVVANIDFHGSLFPNSNRAVVFIGDSQWVNEAGFFNSSNTPITSFDLSTSADYWFILSDDNSFPSTAPELAHFIWARDITTTPAPTALQAPRGTTSNSSASSGSWVSTSAAGVLAMPRPRSQSFIMWDPKATNAIAAGGMARGQTIDSVLSDVPVQVTTKDAMCRHLSQQLYAMARPRTTYSFPKVTAPNIPPVPGDPIVISDDILGFSATTGNQVVLAVCGDMTYSWGQLGSGNYEAPTNLAIQAVAVHPRYR